LRRIDRYAARLTVPLAGALLMGACAEPASPDFAADVSGDTWSWGDAADASAGSDADALVGPDAGADSQPPDAREPDGSEPPPPAEGVVAGSAPAALADYERMCAACHGTMGEGAIAPRLAGTTRGRDTLVAAISDRMPPADPSLCVGDCAERMADAILSWIHPGEADACGYLVAPAPRGMPLLTRRELRNSLMDVLGADATCAPTRFEYNADAAHRTVHVAGSFNGWAGTIDAGGWAMTPSGNTWSLTRDLPPA
jgi:cytochrome c553